MNPKLDPANLDAFLDLEESPPLPVVDRSTLERFARCPAQARYVDAGLVNTSSDIANAGEEGHNALGQTLADYCAEQGLLTKSSIAARLEEHLLASRPDVQPETLRGFRRSVWAWAEFVSGIHFTNILRFDGGVGKRSGQLAADFGGAVRLTAELDLLYAGASKDVLEIVDYKSGWKVHGHDDVRDSFQFGFQSWLVFQNYPEAQAVRVRVWNSRSNQMTWPVYFPREQCSVTQIPQEHGPDRTKVGAVYARLHEAVGSWLQHRHMAPEEAPTWPSCEKCIICPAAALCPAAGRQVAEVALDPVGYVEGMYALENRLDAMRKLAGKYVDEHGDIASEAAGVAFGTEKPKSSRKPPKGLYEIKASENGET